MFGKQPEMEPIIDPTAWMLENPFSEFVLLETIEIKILCMIGYTFFMGNKVFTALDNKNSISLKFVTMIMACTGGGILVPIFTNGIPVPLANDYYIMAILFSFMVHHFFPILRDVFKLSIPFQFLIIGLAESLRAAVVVGLLTAAQKAISPSAFSFPLFGPIMCGSIAGCGGAFFPLNKGLEPIKKGLALPMLTAFVASAIFHIFTSTNLSEDCIDSRKKAHVHVAGFFILTGLFSTFGCNMCKTTDAKKEN